MGEIPSGIPDELKLTSNEPGQKEEAAVSPMENGENQLRVEYGPENKQRFLDRCMSLALDWSRGKRQRKIFAFLGALSTLAGAAYIKRDKIVTVCASVLYSPVLTEYYEKKEYANKQISSAFGGQEADIENVLDQTVHHQREGVLARVDLDNLKLDICEYSRSRDKTPEITLNDPYLENLLKTEPEYVKPPKSSQLFGKLVKDGIERYIHHNPHRGSHYYRQAVQERESRIENGDVQTFIQMTNCVLNDYLDYDEKVSSWISDISNNKIEFRQGEGNFSAVWQSADNMPIDELFQTKKSGVCRHFAECYVMVAEEIKKIYPDRFQNIHPTVTESQHQHHSWNVVYYAKDPTHVELITVDATGGHINPAYNLFRNLYYRGIITEQNYVSLAGEYFVKSKDQSSQQQEFLDHAFKIRSQESLAAIRALLLSRTTEIQKMEQKVEVFRQKLTKTDLSHDQQSSFKDEIETLKYRIKDATESIKPYVDRYNQLSRDSLPHLNTESLDRFIPQDDKVE